MKDKILKILELQNREEAEKAISDLLEFAIKEAFELKKLWDANGFSLLGFDDFLKVLKSKLEE